MTKDEIMFLKGAVAEKLCGGYSPGCEVCDAVSDTIDYLAERGLLGGVPVVWQPISTAPIEGFLWVMLGHPDYHVSDVGYYNKRYNVWCSGDDRTLFMPHGPTHWMPLPAAPKQNEVVE